MTPARPPETATAGIAEIAADHIRRHPASVSAAMGRHGWVGELRVVAAEVLDVSAVRCRVEFSERVPAGCGVRTAEESRTADLLVRFSPGGEVLSVEVETGSASAWGDGEYY